jgi:NADPH:quinone reductase-like Zn-dependent oxidoreductase
MPDVTPVELDHRIRPMLAALYRRTGAPAEVLELVELPDPEPGPGEVRVRLRTAGINPTDTKARAGFRGRPIGFEHQIPGQDGAGEIDRVGAGVDAAREGQRVWVFHAALGRPDGTSAQYVVVPAWQAVPLGAASFETGAALGIPFLTAHRALFRDGPLAGATVLVAGGAGAVGNAAVQLAKRGGARVIATVSSEEKARLATGAGADVVVIGYDRADEISAHAPDGVDRVIEVALTTNLELDLSVLATRGAIVTYATEPDDPRIPVPRLMGAGIRLDFLLIYLTPRPYLEASAAAIGDSIVTLPHASFPLAEVAAAHALAESAHTGRVLLDIP